MRYNGRMIAVVGAGLAGLACAVELRRFGHEVQVYEASDRVGGRCWTVRGAFPDGRYVERGAQLVDSSHTALLSLIAELGLEVRDLAEAQPSEAAPLLWCHGGPYSLEDAAADFAEIQPTVRADHLAVGPSPGHGRMTPRAQELDRLSVAEYLDRLTPGSRLNRLLRTAYTWELGADAEELSALYLVTLLGRNGPGEFELFGPGDARYAVCGGTDLITARLADLLPDRIHLGHALVALRRGAAGFTLVFDHGAAVREVRADRVVLALPFSVLRARVDLSGAGLSERKLRAVNELGMGSSSRTHLEFRGRPWLAAGCDGASVSDTGFQTCWDETLGDGGATSVLVNLRAGRAAGRGADDARTAAEEFLAEFDSLLPGVSAHWTGRATTWNWSRHPWSLGSYAYYRPGQFGDLAGTEAVPEDGCHFAGEHTSPHDSGMNGAVLSGRRAAREIVGAL